MKHLITEAATLEKILDTLSKDPDGPGGSQSELADLIMTDPTSVTNAHGQFVGRYWKWICNQYRQGNVHEGDMPELEAALNTYNINKSQINKPIDSYKTLDELVREIADYDDDFKPTRTLSKGEKEIEKVYEDQYVTVYVPHTVEAARKIGAGTRWCTSSPTSGDYYFPFYLNNYGGEYYDIIRKRDGAKFQIHPEGGQFKNSDDKEINFGWVFNSYREASGLIGFLESMCKNVRKWCPRVWLGDVEDFLERGRTSCDLFDSLGRFRDGFLDVHLNGKSNWVDEDDRLLFPGQWFDETTPFNEGFAAFGLDGKYNWTDTNGKILFPGKTFEHTYGFSNGYARFVLDGKYNWTDKDGNLLSPDLSFDEADAFGENGIAWVRSGEKYNYIDEKGRILSPDLWFDIALKFWYKSDFAEVWLNNGKYRKYLIDRNGNIYDFKTKEPIDKRTLMESERRTIVLTEAQAGKVKRMLAKAPTIGKKSGMERKKIVITEDMAEGLVDDMISEAFRTRYSINSNAVLQVVRYLDSHFTRDTITDVNSDDEIEDVLVGNRIDSHGQVVDQPTLGKIVKKLENVPELRNLVSDKKVRAKFFSIVVYAWHRRWIDMQTGIIYGLNDFEV